MKIFDLHTDVLTAIKRPYEALKTVSNDVEICTAIYKGKMSDCEFKNAVACFFKYKNKNNYLCFEDVGYDGISIDEIISFNPVYVQLTYNDENKYGYGCNYNLGLKPQGVNAVKKLYKNDIYLDVAHLSERAALQACDITDKILCSHALFKEEYYCKRNVSKKVIEKIIENDGLIGFCLVEYFVGEKATVAELIKHIDYFTSNFGFDNIAFGSDFCGSDKFVGGVDWYDKLYVITNELLKIGCKQNEIDKIFYYNAKSKLKKQILKQNCDK